MERQGSILTRHFFVLIVYVTSFRHRHIRCILVLRVMCGLTPMRLHVFRVSIASSSNRITRRIHRKTSCVVILSGVGGSF